MGSMVRFLRKTGRSIRFAGFFLFGVTSLLALLGAGCGTDTQQAGPPLSSRPVPPLQAQNAAGAALIRSGDALSVNLQSIPDPAIIPVQVDDTGAINLRFIGSVAAAGKTPSELAHAIRQAYIEGNYYKEIDVSVVLSERYVYVGGEVNRPGRVIWTPDLTLSSAIAAAGGFSPYARENAVLLNRGDQSYNLDARGGRENTHENTPLFPGDRVNVPRSSF